MIISYIKKLSEFAWFKILGLFIFISFTIRTIFLVRERTEIDFSFLIISKIYLTGLFFDIITLSYFAFIPLIYYILLPNKIFIKKPQIYFSLILYFILIYGIIFDIVAEWFFWDEFSVRFNFIAIDYLIYTTEVIGNIIESYPVYKLVLAIFFISLSLFIITYKKILLIIKKPTDFIGRLKTSLPLISIASIAFLIVDSEKIASRISPNNYATEISYNGIYQLFSAYRNNQLDFDKLYLSTDSDNDTIEEMLIEIKDIISSQSSNSKFISEDPNNFTRFITKPKPQEKEKRHNVIFVTIESLSSEFMEYFGNQENITPNLDKIAKKSLFFTNLKAVGTRTVRGLEAISLSFPPTPGNSIIRRKNNEGLFNISTPFRRRGYDTKFIYGGHGYFDNMNYFFGHNGFKTIDRINFNKDKIAFSNIWGVSDEDLFTKTIEEADKSYSRGKPFFSFLMTTSNHRPFTYPEGRIDIPSKTSRNGAVKYTDYAIGKLIEDAKKKPWFKNTIFVIISDHCAGSAGNSDLPLWRYQIPAMIYAPEIIKPRIFDKNISQIDMAPTLMGLLNFSYYSKFFGEDVISNEKYLDQRAFISTYEKVGYYKNDRLYILLPKKSHRVFDVKINKVGWNGSEETLTQDYSRREMDETIDYYQTAYYLFTNGLMKEEPNEK